MKPTTRWIVTREWVSFLGVGLLNTGLSYGLYLLLRLVMDYRAAYALAYIFGVVVSYCFNAKLVFNTSFSLRGFLLFPLVYVGQTAVATLALQMVVDTWQVDARIAPLLVAAIFAPVTYTLSKAVLAR